MTTKRKLAALAASFAIAATTMATAQANEVPDHGHLLLTGVEVDASGRPVSYEGCRLLANGRAVPLHAHHDTVHAGRAGNALRAAGNMAVPLAPLAPWSSCEEFDAIYFGR